MKRRNQEGFTLIEVLVSVIVLSIGVLGLGMMQLSSLQNTQGGYLRSQATIHAYSIIDAMRANTPAVTAGAFDMQMGSAMPDNVNCRGLTEDCTAAQMAQNDLQRWRQMLNSQLPSGDGQIVTADAGLTTQVTIQIAWIDPYSAENGQETLTLVTEMPR